MTDPRRFEEGEATEFERWLFEAAKRQTPGAVLTARMREGLGLAIAPVAIPVAAQSFALSWKLGVFLGLVAIGAATTMSLVERARRRTTSLETVRAIPESLSAGPPASPSSKDNLVQPTLAPSGATDSLTDEIHLLDRARAALSAGAPRRALDVLEQYDRQYPRGRVEPEAIVLRIQALHAEGNTESARALGQQFMARYPTNPLANRVAKIVRRP